MMFRHDGLYLTDQHIQRARQSKDRPPLKAAWDNLIHSEPTHYLAQIHVSALRYRLTEDAAAGEQAVLALRQTLTSPLPDQQAQTAETLAMAQCVELLREHPAADEADISALCKRVEAVHALSGEQSLTEYLWLTALDMAVSIIVEDAEAFQYTAGVFRQTVDEELHPEGYFPKVVETGPEVAALQNQILAVQAMVLIAEMASHQGVDLWAYEKRGVSVLTAATYPLYYYFYPEKWKWNGEKWKPSDGVPEEAAKTIFRRHAGYLEMAAPRYDRPLRAINMILDEIRPVYDLYGGGFVTLTHALPQRRGMFR